MYPTTTEPLTSPETSSEAVGVQFNLDEIVNRWALHHEVCETVTVKTVIAQAVIEATATLRAERAAAIQSAKDNARNFRRSEVKRLEAEKELAAVKAELDEHKASEKCFDCDQSYSPSLIESGSCIFCIAKSLKAELEKAKDDSAKFTRELNYLYWSAYHSGHSDTVESRYDHVPAFDRFEHHADAVRDCLEGGDMSAIRSAIAKQFKVCRQTV